MKEIPFNFNVKEDPELVVFTDDTSKNSILKDCKDLCFSANEMYSRLKDGNLEKGFCTSLLSLFESYITNLHRHFNYDSILKEEHDKRYIEIRKIHSENRELRQQLGDKVSAEDVREKLKNMKETIYEWWKKEGFGHVSETTFHSYCCSIKLNCVMSIHSSKEHAEYLRCKGYEILELERGCFELKQTDRNTEILINEINKRFPSSRLSKIESNNFHNYITIRDVEVYVRDFGDI